MAIETKRFINSRKSCSCSMPGAWRAVAYMRGVVVIFHSPRSCTHVATTMDINAHFRSMGDGYHEKGRTVPLVSSLLSEKESIFGGTDKLQRCIDFVVQAYHPPCVVIANSCVSGVIGDDVGSVAADAEAQYQIPFITLNCYGFLDGEYYGGYFETIKNLIARFMKPLPKQAGTAVLFGDNGGPWGHYATEVTRLLRGMGVRVLSQFPSYLTLEEVRQVPSAEGMVILGGKGKTQEGFEEIAQELEEKFHIKHMPQIYPVGWSDTQKWILAMGELFQCQKAAQQVLEQEQADFAKMVEKFVSFTKNKKAILCVGRWLMYFDPVTVIETMERLQLDFLGIVMLNTFDDDVHRLEMEAVIRACTDVPIYNYQEGSSLLQEADIVLSTHELQEPGIKQIFLPMLPKVGTKGEKDFMQAIQRTLCSKNQGGGIFYVK